KPGSIRLLASDIDGTLLNPQFKISADDLAALRRAHAAGIEIVLVTGRRHTFALPIAEHLDDLNGSIRRWLEKNMEYIEFVVPIENSLTTDPVQTMFCGSMVRMAEALRALEATGLGNRMTVLRTEYPERDLSMIDVLNAGCSKGHALERWAAHRGFRREEVMAIGDNHNDVEMLEFAGHPVIMGNACAELRARGWRETLANDNCGVAAAIADLI